MVRKLGPEWGVVDSNSSLSVSFIITPNPRPWVDPNQMNTGSHKVKILKVV